MPDQLLAQGSILTIVTSPTESSQCPKLGEGISNLVLGSHETPEYAAKGTGLNQVRISSSFKHSIFLESTPNEKDGNASGHVSISKVTQNLKFDYDALDSDRNTRQSKLSKRNKDDSVNASQKNNLDAASETLASGMALQVSKSNTVSTASYHEVSTSILDLICDSFSGSPESHMSTTKRQNTTEKIAAIIKSFVATNSVSLLTHKTQTLSFIRTEPWFRSSDFQSGDHQTLDGLASDKSSPWNKFEHYSIFLPVDIVDRLKRKGKRRDGTITTCIADTLPRKTQSKSRCSSRVKFDDARFDEFVQELSQIPRPCEFSTIAKLLLVIVDMTFCTQFKHQRRARLRIHKLCQHFYQDVTSITRDEELQHLNKWLGALTKDNTEDVLPKVSPEENVKLAEQPPTEIALGKDEIPDTATAAHTLFLFEEQSWYKTSGFVDLEFGHVLGLHRDNFVRYEWAVKKKELTAQELVEITLKERLSKTDLKARGALYVYRHADGIGFHKIGRSKTVARRLINWEVDCDSATDERNELLREIDRNAPHPMRLEALVFAELKEKRYEIIECTRCGRGHIEWFEVNADEAQKVVKKWTLWMQQNPYDENGQFRTGEIQIPLVGDCKVVPKAGNRGKPAQKSKSGLQSPPKPRRSGRLAQRSESVTQLTHDYALRSKDMPNLPNSPLKRHLE